MKRFLTGDTVFFTWTNSGVAPSQISSALLDKDDVLVNSMTAVSSGNGHYFAPHTLPNTPGFYVNEWKWVLDSYPGRARQRVRGTTGEAD